MHNNIVKESYSQSLNSSPNPLPSSVPSQLPLSPMQIVHHILFLWLLYSIIISSTATLQVKAKNSAGFSAQWSNVVTLTGMCEQ